MSERFKTDITERKRAEEAIRKQQQVLRHLLASSDRERQLIAYEIHDGLAQQLTAATMWLQSFDQLRDQNPHEASKHYETGVQLLNESLAEARRLINGLRPPVLDEQGITAAIEHLVHESQAQGRPGIEFHSDMEFDRLEPLVENAVYRIAQESLVNACHHSKSDKVRIELVQEGNRLRVTVQDWGIGFDPHNVGEGCFGLEGIRQRARLFGGHADIESTPGNGTRIIVELPVVSAKSRTLRDGERVQGLK